MTYEKAMDLLNDCYIRCDPCCVGSCEKCISDAKQTAIEALKKQIPKKPQAFSGGWHYECECGEFVEFPDKYCGKCGQAIDWSDDE